MKPDEFYTYIGKISHRYAGIEQDLKRVLVEDWDIEEDKVEKKYGGTLRQFFLEKMKSCHLPNEYYNGYEALLGKFREVSERRNEIVKSDYGLIEGTEEVFRYDFKARGKYSPDMDFDQWKRKGIKPLTIEEVESLVNDLNQIRENVFQLSRLVHIKKTELVNFFTMWAVPKVPNVRNPYKYIHDNKIEGFYSG